MQTQTNITKKQFVEQQTNRLKTVYGRCLFRDIMERECPIDSHSDEVTFIKTANQSGLVEPGPQEQAKATKQLKKVFYAILKFKVCRKPTQQELQEFP